MEASVAQAGRHIMRLAIADIVVKNGRQRTEMGDLESLAESLLRFGQLTPILIDRSNTLIAGERRIEAHKMNGATHIDAIYRDEVEDVVLEELELEENIRRKQLTWQEENDAVARIHKLRQQQDPSWTQAQTAAIIAKPDAAAPQQRDVSQALTLDKMMKLFPELRQAKSKAQALNMAKAKAKQVNKLIEVRERPEVFRAVEEKILLGDSVEVIKTLPDESIDCIITDPPFGVDYDAQVADTARAADSYEDSEASYERLLTMVPDLYRVLRPDAFCVWFFGMSWYDRVKRAFREAGFSVDEIPIIWDRSDGRTFTTSPNHLFTKAYDVAIHAFKGDPILAQRGRPNIIKATPVATNDRELTVERPIELYAELVRRLTVRGQIVADFFAGSGSCPAAAASLERDYIAVERDPARRAHAIQKVQAHTPIK